MKYILLFLALYIAFQFIFRLVIPLFVAGRQLRKGFKQMQDQMQEQMRAQQGANYRPGPSPEAFTDNSQSKNSARTTKPSSEDYIEFEEVKATKN